MPQTSSPATRENNITRSFDCPICYQSLAKPGPSLDKFSLGQLSKSLTQLSYLERMSIYEEFGVADQYLCNGDSENDKIMATICGHIFHMGCLREWFFTRRYDRLDKYIILSRWLHISKKNLLFEQLKTYSIYFQRSEMSFL